MPLSRTKSAAQKNAGNLLGLYAKCGAFLLLLALLIFVAFPLPGMIPVLMYHAIGAPEEAAQQHNFVSQKSLERQLAFLRFFHYHVLSLDEYYEIKSGKRKARGREILITFDDGYESFSQYGLPLFQKYSLPAAVFIVSEWVRRESDGSMRLETLKRLHETGLITIGSHTLTHPHLTEVSEAEAWAQVVKSRKDLEEMLGFPVWYFAYPHGDFDAGTISAVKDAGYRLAFTTTHKKLGEFHEGPLALTRIKIYDECDNPLIFWYYISGIHNLIKSNRQKMLFPQTRQAG